MTSTNPSDLGNVLHDRVQSRQPSVSFEEVWDRHSKQALQSNRLLSSRQRTRKVWIPAGVAAMIMITVLLSPSVRASIRSMMDTIIIQNKKEAVIYSGWVSSRKWDTATKYATLQDAEKTLGTQLPFPQQLLGNESGAINHELTVTTEKGDVVGYHYQIRTKERMISITANYKSITSPHFNVETTKPTVIKEVDVNGVPAQLFAVQEFDGYTLYMEKGDWKVVIQGFAADVDNGTTSAPHFTETEALNLAQSIQW